jgi:hypothetical protein
MTLTAFTVFLVGSALSARFNFLILYPATIFAAIGTAAFSAIAGDGIGTTILTLALGAVAVQMGYLFGLFSRAVFASFAGTQTGWPRSAHFSPPRVTDSEPRNAIQTPSAGARFTPTF